VILILDGGRVTAAATPRWVCAVGVVAEAQTRFSCSRSKGTLPISGIKESPVDNRLECNIGAAARF
jgi:hypothetical protein